MRNSNANPRKCYYQIRPEFDGASISLQIEDKRCKTGKRKILLELEGGELIDVAVWEKCVKAFNPLKNYAVKKTVIWSTIFHEFGKRFTFTNHPSIETCDELKAMKEDLKEPFFKTYVDNPEARKIYDNAYRHLPLKFIFDRFDFYAKVNKELKRDTVLSKEELDMIEHYRNQILFLDRNVLQK